jgi:hypothetical protein
MPQPNSDPHIVSPPAMPGEPYNATHAGHTATDPWVMLPDSGPCNPQFGSGGGDWPDSPPWMQT